MIIFYFRYLSYVFKSSWGGGKRRDVEGVSPLLVGGDRRGEVAGRLEVNC